jgi:hypothetical protein
MRFAEYASDDHVLNATWIGPWHRSARASWRPGELLPTCYLR